MHPALMPALMLLAGSAPTEDPRGIWACYDVAVLGTLRATDEGYQVSVSKVYSGGRLPDRIDVYSDPEGSYPSTAYHRNAVFYLSRGDTGGFGVLSTAGRQPLDGRGLLTRARVEELARERGLERCTATPA
ncbi:hypothetical protein [Caulobacter sp. NIBR1757]|uniref:hypothetical protein n=1 Tax=Caulobacter sp. NIBR1757 TaxID=3016000 RepID=UPI0022F12C27|nr:hypothetical protein [Caulobacter sp. NIBR1757]WGM40752.1 hypothetical protein AMEJIAPC_03699 [Caulobacter sp. NIBR1757]